MAKFHTFKAVVHNTQIRFNVPVAVARSMGLKSGDFLQLAVKSTFGHLLYKDNEQLRSGYEIYGEKISQRLKCGQSIVVKAWR